MVVQHLKQIGNVKKLDKWVPYEQNENKHTYIHIYIYIYICLKCCLLLFYATTMSHFSIRLWHSTKNAFYTTTGNDQFSGWTEKKP